MTNNQEQTFLANVEEVYFNIVIELSPTLHPLICKLDTVESDEEGMINKILIKPIKFSDGTTTVLPYSYYSGKDSFPDITQNDGEAMYLVPLEPCLENNLTVLKSLECELQTTFTKYTDKTLKFKGVLTCFSISEVLKLNFLHHYKPQDIVYIRQYNNRIDLVRNKYDFNEPIRPRNAEPKHYFDVVKPTMIIAVKSVVKKGLVKTSYTTTKGVITVKSKPEEYDKPFDGFYKSDNGFIYYFSSIDKEMFITYLKDFIVKMYEKEMAEVSDLTKTIIPEETETSSN